jgi:hypothetical protein
MEQQCEPKLSGTIFLDSVEAFKQLVGVETVRVALERLPDDKREEMRLVLPASRIRPNLLAEVSEVVAKVAGRDTVELHVEAVRAGMKHTLKKIWQPLLRVTTDQALIKRAPLFYSRAYEGGALSASLVGPGRAEAVLTGWPNAPGIHLLGIGAAIEAILTFAGRKNVKAHHDITPDGAVFKIAWQA